jgi:hypothetical protein
MSMGAGITFDIDWNEESGIFTARVASLAGFATRADDRIKEQFIGTGTTWLEALNVAVSKAYAESERDLARPDAGEMNLEDLQKLKIDLYLKAYNADFFSKLRLIYNLWADYNGNYNGGKRFLFGDLTIREGDFGICAEYKKKVVARLAGRKEAGGLFVPGAWVGIVDVLYTKALAEDARQRNDKREDERQKLLAELGLI